jgi:primosomal protein N' (replication factor Y)
MHARATVVDVVFDPRSGGAAARYSYLPVPGLNVGDAVLAPLGNRQLLGCVIQKRTVSEEELGFEFSQLRPVAERIDGLNIPGTVLECVQFTADQTLTSLSQTITLALPSGLKDRFVAQWKVIPNAEAEMTRPEREVLESIIDLGGVVDQTSKTSLQLLALYKSLRAKGLLEHRLRLKSVAHRSQAAMLFRLSPDRVKTETFLREQGLKKPAQAMVVMEMQKADGAPLSGEEIRATAGVTETTIKALKDAGILEVVDESQQISSRKSHQLNPAQQLAIDAISHAVTAQTASPFLLYGVTGSGKTEVFLRCATESLKLGRQVLYLVPEIALATQAIGQLRERFGSRVAIIHSEQTVVERLHNWQLIRTGQASVVLGPRSAVFAPLTNIGLIVMDEEHESGYKQESSPRYHARNVVRLLARLHRCPVVLGSATPSFESFFEAEQNEHQHRPERLTLLTLPNRAAATTMPVVHVQDLTDVFSKGAPTIFSPLLSQKLTQVMDRKEQAILFLNRRAYAPFLMCRTCGFQWSCPSCAATLSFHKNAQKLKCHHCGYQERIPQQCPRCESPKIKPFGIGTEKVESETKEIFAGARVARLDRDVIQRKGALEEVMSQFRSGEIDVLIGTQLVAKGLDFPNVTLVGVIAADISLNLPDFRASERTFQLLCQVAGRSGRAQKPGEVVIQTFNPDAPAVRLASNHDYLGFYQASLGERSQLSYPPFSRLINLVFSSDSREKVVGVSAVAMARLQALEGVTLLGPADCPMERLAGKSRRHILLKVPPDYDLQSIGAALESVADRGCSLSIDVDAYNLM